MDTNLKDLIENSITLFGKKFRHRLNGEIFTFNGVIIAKDDYYYHMQRDSDGGYEMFSCCVPLSHYELSLIEDKTDDKPKIKKQYRKLAKKAGFVFWDDENYGPGKHHIDWSNEYDEEFNKFADLLVKEVIDTVESFNAESMDSVVSNQERSALQIVVDKISRVLHDKFDV